MFLADKNFNLKYFITREGSRWKGKFSDWQLDRYKKALNKRYELEQIPLANSPKVYIHKYDYHWLYLASIRKSFEYKLVSSPEEADAIIFQTNVDESLNLENKDIYIFYGEPEIYTKVHFSKLSKDFFEKNRVTIISHHPDPAYFLTPTGPFKFIRTILFDPFLHSATIEDLEKIDGSDRKKSIFTITSALSGIAGNDNKKRGIEKIIEKGIKLDLYGRISRAAVSIKNYKGTCTYKYKLMKKYKYNLILENSPEEEWWVSEKIYDALICGCMPIYYGSDKVFKILPSDWFYFLPSFEDDELAKLQKFINSDAYLTIANNRREIAEYVDRNFSFFSAIETAVNHKPFQFYIED